MADEIAAPAETPVETPVVETPDVGSSVNAALDAAFDATFGDAEDSPTRERDEFGRFKAKEPSPDTDPEPVAEPEPAPEIPDEFAAPPPWLNEGKDEWAKAPKPLREALSKRYSEMERGIAQYREQITPFQPFFDMAKASNVDPVALVGRYVDLDKAFTANPLQGFDMIARSLGTDMRTIAAHIMGQPAPEKDAQVSQLQQQTAALQQEVQQLRGVAQRAQAEQQAQVQKQVEEFWAANPRAEELAPIMEGFLPSLQKLPPAQRLAVAYRLAEQAMPAPVTDATARTGASEPATARTGANPKTTLSISGAPSSGSNPASAPKSTGVMNSVEYALSKVGLG